MRFFLVLVYLCAAIFASGCSKQGQASQQSSVVTLASDDRGRPQLDYSGPGKLSYRNSFESFSFEIGSGVGAPWATGKGAMNFTDSNHVIITVQSSSERPYDIQLLGVWTNRTLDIPEEKAKETIHVLAGDQKLHIERFVIWTYDFSKDK